MPLPLERAAVADDDDDDHLVTELTVFAVPGAGFVTVSLGVEWLWMVWVLGFAVVPPAVAVVVDNHLAGGDGRDDESDDAIAELRARYARGELTEAEFER